MILLQNLKVIGFGASGAFGASGGTPPYTYSVDPDGVGGTVNSSGVYTAPQRSGIDTVRAVDSLGAAVTATIQVSSVLQVLCDIIASELGLDGDQVILWNQDFPELKDQRLYIAVGVLQTKPFSNSLKFLPRRKFPQKKPDFRKLPWDHSKKRSPLFPVMRYRA